MEQALQNFDQWSADHSSQPIPRQQLADLEKQALNSYEKSLDPKTRNEESVAARRQARLAATQLSIYPETRVNAYNLLSRIALDEGFYRLAHNYIKTALAEEPENAGCWFSLGHIHLAECHYDQAMSAFTKALDIAPNETRAATSLAYTLAKKGHTVSAFQAYRNLFHAYPDDDHIQAKLFELIGQIKADVYMTDLEEDVVKWLKLNNVNHQQLAPLVMSLLTHKYDLTNDNAVIDIQKLASDELLELSLGKVYFTSPNIESFLINLRKQVLLNCIACNYQDRKLFKLATGIALHAEHNEHLYLYDKEEQSILSLIIKLLATSISQHQKPPVETAQLVSLYGMYENLLELSGIDQLTKKDLTDWPDFSLQLIQQGVIDYLTEADAAGEIKPFESISDSVSVAVKQQYEEHPYPRWLHLGYNTPTNYGRALEQELVNFKAPDFFNMGTIKVLIAGCGTGQHALTVARYFRNVEVTAIDISSRSLAYAIRKSKEYEVENIRFLNLDILSLNKLQETFHIIECSGVLHHMENPEAGLARLKERLHPKGLIKLGLYSEEARKPIKKVRDIISDYGVPTNRSAIRSMRQAIIGGNLPFESKGILESQDFYSSSGCRDLLFHAQELLFTPQRIESLLASQNLNFLGFVLPGKVKAQYDGEFSGDPERRNLSNWEQFETRHPSTFARMYQFYIRIEQ